MADASNSRDQRSCLGCLANSGLGCLAFLSGAALALVMFGTALLGGKVQETIEERLSARIAGSVEFGSFEAALTETQAAGDVVLRAPNGQEVARGSMTLPSTADLLAGGSDTDFVEVVLRSGALVWDADGVCPLVEALRPVAVDDSPLLHGRLVTVRVTSAPGVSIEVASGQGLRLALSQFAATLRLDPELGVGLELTGTLGETDGSAARLTLRSDLPDEAGLRSGSAGLHGIPRAWVASWLGDHSGLADLATDTVDLGLVLSKGPSGRQHVEATVDPGLAVEASDLALSLSGWFEDGRFVEDPAASNLLRLPVPAEVFERAGQAFLPKGERWRALDSETVRIDLTSFDLPVSWSALFDPLDALRRGSWKLRLRGGLGLGFQPVDETEPWSVLVDLADVTHDGDGEPDFSVDLKLQRPGRDAVAGIEGVYVAGRPELTRWEGPSSFLDDLLGIESYLADLFGDGSIEIGDLRPDGGRPFVLDGGPGRRLELVLRENVLVLEGPTADLEIDWATPLAQDVLRTFLPVVDFDRRNPPSDGKLRLRLESLYMPLPYDATTIAADVVVDVGDAVGMYTSAFRKEFPVGDAFARVEDVEPVIARLAEGVVSYELFELELDDALVEWIGSHDLNSGLIVLQGDVPVMSNPSVRSAVPEPYRLPLASVPLDRQPRLTVRIEGTASVLGTLLIASGQGEAQSLLELGMALDQLFGDLMDDESDG